MDKILVKRVPAHIVGMNFPKRAAWTPKDSVTLSPQLHILIFILSARLARHPDQYSENCGRSKWQWNGSDSSYCATTRKSVDTGREA